MIEDMKESKASMTSARSQGWISDGSRGKVDESTSSGSSQTIVELESSRKWWDACCSFTITAA
jgi:hypothetical protein